MNIEPRPSTQMPVGNVRSAPAAAEEDGWLLERGLFMHVVIEGWLTESVKGRPPRGMERVVPTHHRKKEPYDR